MTNSARPSSENASGSKFPANSYRRGSGRAGPTTSRVVVARPDGYPATLAALAGAGSVSAIRRPSVATTRTARPARTLPTHRVRPVAVSMA